MLQPIAVDPKTFQDALADAQAIAIGFTQVTADEKTEFYFPANASLIKKLEETFEINLHDELSFFQQLENLAKYLKSLSQPINSPPIEFF